MTLRYDYYIAKEINTSDRVRSCNHGPQTNRLHKKKKNMFVCCSKSRRSVYTGENVLEIVLKSLGGGRD